MSTRNIAAVLLIIASLACLYPGVTQPLLQIKVAANVPIIGSLQFYDETQSILQSITSLYQQKNTLVATLILLFSIVVPISKALLLLLALFLQKNSYKFALHNFVGVISKWSMADVFVVSVFMAFLATQSNAFIEAMLHPGFYYFLAYCLVSIIATQLLSLNFFPPATSRSNEALIDTNSAD